MIKAVIFDRDGVLIDSEATNIKAAELAFGEFGIKLTQEEKDGIVGRHPDDYLIPFKEKYDIDYEKYRELQRKYYIEYFGSTPLFEGTINLLKEISSRGITLALCTSSNRELTFQLLERIGVRDLFQVVVAKGDYSKRKPDPEPYMVTAEKLGIKPEDCLVIEDSDVGLKSAIGAGMKCVVIYNEYTRNQDFTGAFKVVSSADIIDLEELIRQ